MHHTAPSGTPTSNWWKMSDADSRTPGWYPNPGSGGTRYWDGTRWTAETLPPAPQLAPSKGLGILFIVFGGGCAIASPFASELNDGSVSTVGLFFGLLVSGLAAVPLGVYLFRGSSPWIQALDARHAALNRKAELAQQYKAERRAAALRRMSAPSREDALVSLQITRTLRNLHHLRTTNAITEAEYQAEKARLLGDR